MRGREVDRQLLNFVALSSNPNRYGCQCLSRLSVECSDSETEGQSDCVMPYIPLRSEQETLHESD